MKKHCLLSAFVLITLNCFSQEVGVRLGDVVGNDVAIDGIFKTGEFNRVHADVSFGHGLGLEALWDFIDRPLGGTVLNWYVGAGPSILFYDQFWVGISGEIGLEYHFKEIPLALGLDWRPTFYLIDDVDFYGGGFGFNARYVFGKN